MSTTETAERVVQRSSGARLAVAAAFAFSSSSVFAKNLLKTLDGPTLMFFRFGLAAALMWGFRALAGRDGTAAIDPRTKRTIFLLGLVFGAHVELGTAALQRLDASVYIVLIYMYPAFVVVGSALLGTRITGRTVAALALLMAGVVMTVPELFGAVGNISLVGVALVIAQAVINAGHVIAQGRLIPAGTPGMAAASWNLAGCFAVTVPIGLIHGLGRPQGASTWVQLILYALVPTVVSTSMLLVALRDGSPPVISMILTLEVALTIVWSMLVLHEHVKPIQWVGAAVVIAGVIAAQRTTTPTAPVEVVVP